MSKFGLRHQCARGALACAMALTPAIAHAQDAGAANTEEADLIDAADVDSGSVIIVRAQGREQALADVPVAVSAVSGELLEKSGVADIRDLNQVAPSLLISSTGNEANGSARIRGIGTVGDNPGLESSVAVFVDGVYRSRSGNAMAELGPLDRVEILRGPQGTLGGRNSSAGLINIYTAPPEFEFSGYGAFTYGNYDAIKVEAGINAPLGDTVAARIDDLTLGRPQDPAHDRDQRGLARPAFADEKGELPGTDVEIYTVQDGNRLLARLEIPGHGACTDRRFGPAATDGGRVDRRPHQRNTDAGSVLSTLRSASQPVSARMRNTATRLISGICQGM